MVSLRMIPRPGSLEFGALLPVLPPSNPPNLLAILIPHVVRTLYRHLNLFKCPYYLLGVDVEFLLQACLDEGVMMALREQSPISKYVLLRFWLLRRIYMNIRL